MVGIMVATFLGCAMITHWLPHTLIQKKICLILDINSLESMVLYFLFEYANSSFCLDFINNSNIITINLKLSFKIVKIEFKMKYFCLEFSQVPAKT